ncbi:diguanylate cyclase [Paenibacillus swuensis]|uniref:Diguanylate cyclase n=1 Tax=Paenibacillus swuensis TaxID=1178515 RepID=A0A172TFV9_9BACL|nr:diguanylate cyclase [Paenibacillus swuensis]ANE45673.1 diguanylate cyclase [Paenibacillus swuensis]
MSLRLRTLFAVVFGLLIMGLTGIFGYIISKESTRQVERSIGGSLSETAYQMAEKLDYFMWSRAGEIQVLSRLETFQDTARPDRIRNLLDELQNNFPAFTWVGYTDAQGKVLASTNGILTGGDLSKRPVYLNGSKGMFIGDVHEAVLLSKLLPNPTGEPLQFVDISVPVYDASGALKGVLAAHLSWAWSREVEQSILKPLEERSEQLDAFIISKKDNTVLLGPKDAVGKAIKLASTTKAQQGRNGWMTETFADDKKYLTGYAYGKGYLNYPGLGWTILVRQPMETAFFPVNQLQRFIVIVGVLGTLLFGLIGWIAASWIARPLKRIADAADDLRSGKRVEIPVHTGIKDIEILSLSLRKLVHNLTETESALGQMENLAHHDRLTGLPNRAGLELFLEGATKQAVKDEVTLTFLFMDLDGFKSVNDSLGHAFGDRLLQHVAVRLKACVRAGELVVRLGGDEFVAVLRTSHRTPTDEARMVAGRMIASINQPFYLDGETVNISCSLGGAVWPDSHIDPAEAIRLADGALYQSKRSGKNRATFAS